MKYIILFLLAVVLLLSVSISYANEEVELFRLRIINDYSGLIEVSLDRGNNWITLGKVDKPAVTYNSDAFRASGYIESGVVSASAVNAIHITVGKSEVDPINTAEKSGRIISIIPRGTDISSELNSRILTNIEGGTLIFREWAPFVGNKVFLEKEELSPIPENYTPSIGDRLVILVTAPSIMPKEILFENKVDGNVYLCYSETEREVIAKVVRAVRGTGRFGGTLFAYPSSVRANHPGVIDISTSDVFKGEYVDATPEDTGGFQIIPNRHANTPELRGVWTATQWMILAPINENFLEGSFPLFRGLIRPGYTVEGRFGDSNVWTKLPVIKGLNNTALSNLREFKIILPPIEITPPKEVVAPPVITTIKMNVINGTLEIEGTADPGVKIQVIVNNSVRGEGYSKADGFFYIKNIQASSRNLVTCRAIDPAGRESRIGRRIGITIPTVDIEE
ncbi:MAG: hypothetical protein N2380_05490 [bacterium]|nr:hypothetical protein [bacterium]